MNTSKIALASFVVATAALTAGCDTLSSMGDRMRGGSSSASGEMNSQSGQYWTRNSKDGYMTRESSMNHRGSDGRAMDFSKADSDSDGRISEREWRAYHSGR